MMKMILRLLWRIYRTTATTTVLEPVPTATSRSRELSLRPTPVDPCSAVCPTAVWRSIIRTASVAIFAARIRAAACCAGRRTLSWRCRPDGWSVSLISSLWWLCAKSARLSGRENLVRGKFVLIINIAVNYLCEFLCLVRYSDSRRFGALMGLFREIDFKNFDQNLKNLA